MISFLRITKNIKVGDYLHSDGNIDNTLSNNIIGVCVIPSNFLPDKYARFMTLEETYGHWANSIELIQKTRKRLPGNYSLGRTWGVLDSSRTFTSNFSIISPYLSDNSLNPDFIKDIDTGNACQDYKGYETNRIYKEKYGEDVRGNIFSRSFSISPNYKRADWYAPSLGELVLSLGARSLINLKIQELKYKGKKPLFNSAYWSSTEFNRRIAWFVNSQDDYIGNCYKTAGFAIRAFLAL